jgi:acetyl-CoA carboxylase biotin carboxylase subunit
MFQRVLVANRGEIAVRVIRCLKDLGVESVAVYSDADRDSLHVKLADYAVHLPGKSSLETYLHIPRIIEAIHVSGADAVHPGYGFLSENARFATAVRSQTKAVFIGPSSEALVLMGDKIEARKHMKKHQITTVPGLDHALQDFHELERVAQDLGFPILLKAAGGGGGRGMRIVWQPSDLREAYDVCRREAQMAFNSPDIFCERYLANPRHIEFQILCDRYGQGVHLFERECSVQRRYQKLFEEAPSTFLNAEQRMRFGEVALAVARSCQYEGVGTIEFIAESPEALYFMEMNTRIQVEHPVTEMITGVDLIAEQIRVAAGEKLRFAQKDLSVRGWSLEARINAEDPQADFRPSSGLVSRLHWPAGPHVRVDSFIYPGYEIPAYYDSLLGKLIVWGATRQEALQRMERALGEMVLEGVCHTGYFHERLIRHPAFREGRLTTHFLQDHKESLQQQNPQDWSDDVLALGAYVAGHASMN